MAGQQAHKLSFFINDRERAETEFPLFNHREHVANKLVGRDDDRLLNQAVNVIFHAADFGKLFAVRHVVMNEAEPAVERHGNRHARLGHGVHVGRNDGNIETQTFRKLRVEMCVARENLGIKRCERDVVEREREMTVRGEKLIRRLVELAVESRIARCCHVGK